LLLLPSNLEMSNKEEEAPKYQLEDILNKKKPPPQILDLHGLKIDTEDEFRKAIEKIPDYKIKAEKVRGYDKYKYPEDNNLQEYVIEQPVYEFSNPCPPSMRQVRISDLSSVDINWKMLTLARPDTKIEEQIFSKLVQLDKLRLSSRQAEVDSLYDCGGKDPDIIVKAASESKGGVIEKLVKTCEECGEEFCYGACIQFQYDSYQRVEATGDKEAEDGKDKQKKGKIARKKKKKTSGGNLPSDRSNILDRARGRPEN